MLDVGTNTKNFHQFDITWLMFASKLIWHPRIFWVLISITMFIHISFGRLLNRFAVIFNYMWWNLSSIRSDLVMRWYRYMCARSSLRVRHWNLILLSLKLDFLWIWILLSHFISLAIFIDYAKHGAAYRFPSLKKWCVYSNTIAETKNVAHCKKRVMTFYKVNFPLYQNNRWY